MTETVDRLIHGIAARVPGAILTRGTPIMDGDALRAAAHAPDPDDAPDDPVAAADPQDADPDAPYPVPPDAAFVDPAWIAKGGIPGTPDAPLLNFIDAPDLVALAEAIVAANPRDFRHLRDPFNLTVDYSWRREGGKKAGRHILGTCARVSGTEEKHVAATWKIVLNADILRGRSNRQVEAVLYHELLHTGLTDKLKPTLVGHDVELFYRDIARSGFVFDDWRQLRDVVQLRLFEDGEKRGDE